MSPVAPDSIPPLRPPLPEIPPSFWELHGTWVIVAAVLALAAVAAAVWFLTRPRKVIAPPPSVQAGQALGLLKAKAEDGALLSRVSQVLRGYLAAAFALPAGELTTTEFCRALGGQEQVGAELSSAISEFLRQCDERKFAPHAVLPPLAAVEQALRFIAAAEERLTRMPQEQLRPLEPTAATREARK